MHNIYMLRQCCKVIFIIVLSIIMLLKLIVIIIPLRIKVFGTLKDLFSKTFIYYVGIYI